MGFRGLGFSCLICGFCEGVVMLVLGFIWLRMFCGWWCRFGICYLDLILDYGAFAVDLGFVLY